MKSVTASIAFLISLSFSAAFAQDRFYSWSDQFETGEAGDLEMVLGHFRNIVRYRERG